MSQHDPTVYFFNRRKIQLLGLAVTFVIYLGTLSRWLDRNSIYELIAIEQGNFANALRPNHMLFRPLAYGFFRLWQVFGYTGKALLPTQVMVAFSAALGLIFLWLIFGRISNSPWISTWLTIAYGASFAYWYWATNVHYILLSETCILAAFLIILQIDHNTVILALKKIVMIGILTALAVGFWQASILIIIPFSYGLLFLSDEPIFHQRLKLFLIWLSLTLVMLSTLYIAVGVLVHNVMSPLALWIWLTTYPGRFDIWGHWDLGRVLPAVHSALSAVLPIWTGLGLRALLRGEFLVSKMIPQLSLVVSIFFGVFVVSKVVKRRTALLKENKHIIIMSVLWFAAIVIFILWWDPFEPRWWLIALLPIWFMLAIALKGMHFDSASKLHLVLPMAWACIILLANFQSVIVPRRFGVDPARDSAVFAVAKIDGEDLLIDLFLEDWAAYIRYLYDRDVLEFSSLTASVGREKSMEILHTTINEHIQDGHHVYIEDWHGKDDSEWIWPLGIVGIKKVDLTDLEVTPGWCVQDNCVLEITGIRP